MRAWSTRLGTAVAACAVGALASCTSGPDPGPDIQSTLRETIVYDETGIGTRDIEIAIAITGSGPEHHVALDAVTIPNWIVDTIEFDAADWPVVVESEEDKVIRTLHVRAHASFVDREPHPLDAPLIDLVRDDGPLQIASGTVSADATFDPCSNLTVDAIAAQLGLKVLAGATTQPGAIDVPFDIVGNAADGTWTLGLALSSPLGAVDVLRLLRTKDGITYLPKEVPGFGGALALGAGGSVVVALEGNDGRTFVRYDGEATKGWTHTLAGYEGTTGHPLAVAGGRVFVDAPGFGVYFDGEPLPATTLNGTWILLDESTGDVLSTQEGEHLDGMIGLSDGAFAVVRGSQVSVIEADLSTRWTADIPVFATPFGLSEQPGKLWLTSPVAAHAFDLGTGAPSGAPIMTGVSAGGVAPLPDGSVLIWSQDGSLRRKDAADNMTEVRLTSPAPWCAPTPSSVATSTPGGAAFAMSIHQTDINLPGFDKPLPAFVGVVTP